MKILEILENGVSNGDDGELLDAWKKLKYKVCEQKC